MLPIMTVDDLYRRLPYTLREILHNKYPELLEIAESGCAVMEIMQNALIELLPLSKGLLPYDTEQLHKAKAQAAYRGYIYEYSLFKFIDAVYSTLHAQCTELAEALNSCELPEEKNALDKVRDTLNALYHILPNSDDLLSLRDEGLQRLYTLKEFMGNRFDFPVISVYKENGTLRGTWSFLDIMGTIDKEAASHKDLLTDLHHAPIPSSPTIGKVVDDEKMVRIY